MIYDHETNAMISELEFGVQKLLSKHTFWTSVMLLFSKRNGWKPTVLKNPKYPNTTFFEYNISSNRNIIFNEFVDGMSLSFYDNSKLEYQIEMMNVCTQLISEKKDNLIFFVVQCFLFSNDLPLMDHEKLYNKQHITVIR